MTDLDRLTEALEYADAGQIGLSTTVHHWALNALYDAARSYRDLLANPAEPDWEAAASALWNSSFGEPWESDLFSIAKGKAHQEAKAVVEAAVGDRLLVEKP